MRVLMWAMVALLVVAPAAESLNIGSRSMKVRDSEEYSPETAWDLGYYGCGVTIAVFDEGVDDKHPHLDGKVVAGIDVTATGTLWTQANGGNPQPFLGTHGTPVAGLALSHAGKPFFTLADKPDYGADDLVGIAPCAWMVDVQFNDISGATIAEMVAAFDWAIANQNNTWGDDDASNDGIEIITMSWSPNDQTDGQDELCLAANRAEAAGIVVLGSAGNSGAAEENTLGCPTGADGALSIANIWNERTVERSDDVLRESSSWGPRTDDGDENPYEELKPDVATPGHGVVGPRAGFGDGSEYTVAGCGEESLLGDLPMGANSCVAGFSGTSAATPMTAGLVALMLEANPELTTRDIREILHQTAEQHPDAEPDAPEINGKWNRRYGYGMVDAFAAISEAKFWPGMELGADTDSDGIRDYRDAAPFNPAISTTVEPPAGLQPAGGMLDSDGDDVRDFEDANPLDPQETGVLDASNEDAPGLPLLLAAMGLVVLAARRR